MSYTIVDDNGVLQIRASINTLIEMIELIEKLEKVRDKLPSTQEKKDDQ